MLLKTKHFEEPASDCIIATRRSESCTNTGLERDNYQGYKINHSLSSVIHLCDRTY